MLEKLPNHSLTNEEDRVRYTDGSTSVTIWFDVDNSIFAFEVIFDLLLKEFVLLYSKKSPTRFINIDDSTSKPGRTVKQSIGSQSLNFPLDDWTNLEKCQQTYLPIKENLYWKLWFQ